MIIRRRCILALLLPLLLLALGCSSDDDSPERELVHHPDYPVPLADLTGTYHSEAGPGDDPPRTRTARTGIPDAVDDFQQLQLVATGTWSPALVEVSYAISTGAVFTDTLSVPGTLDLELVVVDEPGRIYRAEGVPMDDQFTFTVAVDADWPEGTVDAGDLLRQDLDLTLTSHLDLDGSANLIEPAHGELTEVVLKLTDAFVYEDAPSD